MADGDVVVFMNFRADRARADDARADRPRVRRVRAPARAEARALRLPDELRRRILAAAGRLRRRRRSRTASANTSRGLGLTQLRIAETEKYAHVTYFFNGGTEALYPGEDRILVPSPKVATYDLQPEMSAVEVTDRLVAAIEGGRYDAIVCNYANGDMVGPHRQLRGGEARRSRRSTRASAASSTRRAAAGARC